MATLVERIRFTDIKNSKTMKVLKWKHPHGYDILSLYCADHNIDLSNVSDDDFENASAVIEGFGQSDKTINSFYFWIDQE